MQYCSEISLVALAAIAAAAALCADAAGVADEIRAIKAEIKSNSIDRTTKCRYYRAWYADQCDKAELAAIRERNIAAHRRWIALKPNSPYPRASLGRVYAALGKWDEARKELEAAYAERRKLDFMQNVNVGWELANLMWHDGDKDGARKMIAQVAALERKGDTPSTYWRAQYLDMMFKNEDEDIDALRLPHSCDGKPFPTPQRAEYGDAKVSLAKVEVSLKEEGRSKKEEVRSSGGNFKGRSKKEEGKEEGENDPIVRLLKRKLQRFGSKFVEGRSKKEEGRGEDVMTIELEISPDALVDKPQGYLLEVRSKKEEGRSSEKEEVRSKKEEGRSNGGVVLIKARDRLGALWGVVSFLQCVQRKESSGDNSKLLPSSFSLLPSIRAMRIEDWPGMERRGVIDYFQPEFLEIALFGKMSSVTIDLGNDYSLSPLDRELHHIWGERFKSFGIEMYCVIRSKAMEPIIPLSSPRTWRLHLAWTRFIASCGMGMSFHLDDSRFPLHPLDLEGAGSGANLDAKYLTRLYREVKKDYPDFKMQFCPPFYWGPDASARYPEKRDPYLYSLGKDLDSEIDVYWTGPRVKSMGFTPERVQWYIDRIGRKPTVFHNSDCIGRHNHIQYGADPTGFKRSHSPDIFDYLASFQQNMSSYNGSIWAYSAMDWVWNPVAHDPTNSVVRAVDILEGPGVSKALGDAMPSISYFDKYTHGTPRGELFAEDQAELDRRVAEADAAWKKAYSLAKNGGKFIDGFRRGLEWARKLAEIKRNPPEWFLMKHEAEMANNSWARSEVGYDEKNGDQFIPSEMMSGATYYSNITDWSHGKRTVRYVNPGVSVRGMFTCNSYPPPAPYKMLIVGMRFQGKAPTVEVEVNGRVLWRGEPFVRNKFTPLEVELPVDAMRMGDNRFVIRNASAEVDPERKAIIHYIVVRPSATPQR